VPVAVELRPTIDRAWLERAADRDPLAHAYALWDLDRLPEEVRFVSAVRDGTTVGYLLSWFGRPDRPVVHWFGGPDLADAFVPELPPPPFVAVVPREVGRAVVSRFPGARLAPLRSMLRARGAAPSLPGPPVRRLGRADRAALDDLVGRSHEPELAGYVGLDPSGDAVWGAFEGDRLIGVARAAVRLARLWVVGGVFVEPPSRGRGVAAALVGSLVAEAERAAAPVGLFVREEPPTARHLYGRLGFGEVGRRSWVEVGRSGRA
jgi:GNAT superfamily N-acetyltransferase